MMDSVQGPVTVLWLFQHSVFDVGGWMLLGTGEDLFHALALFSHCSF